VNLDYPITIFGHIKVATNDETNSDIND